MTSQTFAESCRELMGLIIYFKSNKENQDSEYEKKQDKLYELYNIFYDYEYSSHIDELSQIWKERLARAKDEVAFLKGKEMYRFIIYADWESCHAIPDFIKTRISDIEEGIKILSGESNG